MQAVILRAKISFSGVIGIRKNRFYCFARRSEIRRRLPLKLIVKTIHDVQNTFTKRIINLIGNSKNSKVINVFTKITELGREKNSTVLLVLALENQLWHI